MKQIFATFATEKELLTFTDEDLEREKKRTQGSRSKHSIPEFYSCIFLSESRTDSEVYENLDYQGIFIE